MSQFSDIQRPEKHRKWLLVFGIVVMVLAGLGALGYWMYGTIQKQQAAAEKRTSLTTSSAAMTPENQEQIYEKYEGDYQTAKKTMYDTPIDEWTKATLDDAYLVLVFNDKTDGIGEVNDVLIMLDYAQSSGLNLDDNSWGFNETDRNAFKQRMLDRQAKYEAGVQ